MTTKPGVRGPRACLPHTVDPMIISASTDYRAARSWLPPFLFHYIDGGAQAAHAEAQRFRPVRHRAASASCATCPT